jgi:hypothetical protein
MGSDKAVGLTEDVLVGEAIRDSCSGVKDKLNDLEVLLIREFPEAFNKTAITRYALQQAWYNHCHRLNDEIGKEDLVLNTTSPIEDVYSHMVPRFIRYLSRFGKVSVSLDVNVREDCDRMGIFLSGNEGKPCLIGFLHVGDNLSYLEYSGYVPTRIPEEEFHFGSLPKKNPKSKGDEESEVSRAVYHLNNNPPKIEGLNFVYVRLFAEKNGDKFERYDDYGTRGISFI